MERKRFTILSNFALATKIMPFYESTDRIFLVLSMLSAATRRKLWEFYNEFRQFMKKYSHQVRINKNNINMVFLPSDLFKKSIILKDKKSVKIFLEFAHQVKSKKGHYFCDYFMHDQIIVGSIQIDPALIRILHSHTDLLRSVSTMKFDINAIEEDLYEDQTLFDSIEISLLTSNAYNNQLSIEDFYKNNNFDDIETNSRKFRRISHVYIRGELPNKNLNNMKLIEKASLLINNFTMSGITTEILENLTDPQYFKGEIESINYSFECLHKISEKTYQNLNSIKPK